MFMSPCWHKILEELVLQDRDGKSLVQFLKGVVLVMTGVPMQGGVGISD